MLHTAMVIYILLLKAIFFIDKNTYITIIFLNPALLPKGNRNYNMPAD
jgi:hypothetical protein